LTEEDFKAAIDTMPWYSTLYDEDRAVMIANKFEVSQIPWLLVLKDGKVSMQEARESLKQAADEGNSGMRNFWNQLNS